MPCTVSGSDDGGCWLLVFSVHYFCPKEELGRPLVAVLYAGEIVCVHPLVLHLDYPLIVVSTTAETPQGITPEGSQDHQLVIRPSIGNNVASKVTLPRRPAKRGDFKIAIICALPIEADAAHALFDRYWDYDGPPYDKAAGDPNAYSTGAVGRHNVVLAHMPGMGKARSASVAAFCKQSFPNIKLALVVGICGGVPFGPNNKEILLGDVIISNGVVQYDLIQRLPGRFIRKGAITDSLGRPDQEITSLLKKLSSRIPRNMLHNEMIAFLDVLRAQADLAAGYPGTDRDKLYQAAYGHVNDKMPCKDCCDDLRLMPRSRLGGGSPQPEVHFGLIASGDSVMKSGEDRDAIAQESPPPDTILGFEMEGAGVWDIFPCVVIKGVCDYADSHKTEDWQQYAAATAAACMKAFLRHWIPSPSVQDDTARPPFHVPYEENKSFIGRSEILDRLRQLPLGSTSHTRETYPDMPVFWVHASNDERFRGGYTAIAQKCKIPDHDNPKEDVMALVKGWLECDSRGEWLMVIDNADDLELFFRQKGGLGHYLPQCAHGTILVTTRNLQAASRLTKGMSMSIIKIGEMDEDETAKLLTTQLGEAETMVGEFSALSARLEHLPLALVQATSFIQENCITISDYIQLLDKSDQHLVDLLSEDFETIGRDSNTPRAVAETWILSFEQIQQRDALAGELLSIMGLLDRQAIPHEFLSTYTEDQEKGELQLTKALGVLKAFSFVVEVKDHAFDMHRLVHLVTRKWLVQKAVMQHFAKQALVVVSECFPLGEYENWTICNTYLPHVSAVLNLKEDTASREGKLARARLLHSVARLFYERGQFQTAEKYQEEAVELKQAELGEEDPNTLVSMNGLALTYWSLGRWKEAELLEVQVLDIRKRVLGKEHPDTLTSMNNLASTYKDQGRWEEAELLQVQVLDIEKRVLGEEHPHTLISMNNLASMYQHQGRWEEAELLQVQVLDIRKRVSGKEHPYTIAYMQEVLGSDHPDTISTHAAMASVYWEQGQFSEAQTIQVEVLEKSRGILGEEHPDTLTSMHNLAFTWKDMGRLEDAIVLMQECLRLRQKVRIEKGDSTTKADGRSDEAGVGDGSDHGNVGDDHQGNDNDGDGDTNDDNDQKTESVESRNTNSGEDNTGNGGEGNSDGDRQFQPGINGKNGMASEENGDRNSQVGSDGNGDGDIPGNSVKDR
ncbi:hypothetical protein B0T21DRAFT_379616 [Apiosordaria backusii]|uniref:Nucleoside phosphorylase domain-containing protein n=1 Tax=Apiosordaria backusii TaxID=314023 RepID=A0AA40EYE8_9PEZI|nr:hypothetical protein B0T21DRAFT_379616 [Apiosordaria backusii]